MNQRRQGNVRSVVKAIAGVALSALAGAAMADDFAGVYVGASAGLSAGKTSTTHALSDGTFFSDTSTPVRKAFVASQSPNLKKDNLTGGAQAGYNWRTGGVVLGFEVDANYLSLNRTTTSGGFFAGAGGGGNGQRITLNDSVKSSLVATLRPRIGYVVAPKSLIYVTAGWALGNEKFSNSDTIVRAGGGELIGRYNGNSVSKQNGTVWGGGYEYAWSNNMTLKAEYQHLQFGNPMTANKDPSIIPAGFGPFSISGSTITTSSKVKADVLRVGVNWRF